MRVFVLTSDKYVGLLPAFAYLFNKHWSPKCPVNVVHYEQRPPALPTNFSLFDNGKDPGFSTGLIRFLKAIPDEHVILFLDDYFLTRVDVNRVAELIRFAERHPLAVKIDLTDDRLKVPHTILRFDDRVQGIGSLEDMVCSEPNAPFLMSTQAAIWRKDFLLRFVKSTENPWQFEKRGSARVTKAYQSGDFDGVILGSQVPPVEYVNACGGAGNKPGEYDRKKIPPAMWDELKGRGLV
jgi:hypothetical protein